MISSKLRPYHRLLLMGSLAVVVAASTQMILALLEKPVGFGNFCTRLQIIELVYSMVIIYIHDVNISRQFNRIHAQPTPPPEGHPSSPLFLSHVVIVMAE